VAAEEGFHIASAWVDVQPDTDGFKERLQSAVEEAVAGVEARIKVTLDKDQFDADADEVKEKVDALSAHRAEPEALLNKTELDRGVDDAKAKVAEVDDAKASATIGADNAPLKEKVDDSKEQLGGLGSTKTTPPVDADIDPAKEKIAELQSELARLRLQKQGVTLDADASPAEIRIAQLQAQITALSQEKTSTEVDADTTSAQEKIAALQAELAALRLQSRGVEIDADATPAEVKIAGLEAEIAAVKGKIELGAEAAPAEAAIADLEAQLLALRLKKQGIILDADATPAEVKIAELQAQITALSEEARNVDIGGGGSSGGGFSLPGGFITGIAGALTAIAPGIAGATTGLGLLGGTGALAFGGIFKAVDAAHQASQNIGMTSAQLAQTEFTNAVQIQQAQQSIASAHMQAAETVRNAEQQNIAALQAVGQAEQQVEEANYGLTEAQYNLSQAYVAARQNIINLNDALANQKIGVQQAQLAVQQAAYQQQLVDQNAYSTNLDKEQAALAVVSAQQQLKDASDQETQAQTAANQANSQGVDGSQTVLQAKQGVTQATYAQKDAVQQLQDAQRNLTVTEANSAASIQQSQIAVANAEQNLTNTVREQQLQWAATMSTENQAANQFARDMARLTPAGRQMVNLILSMSGGLRTLEGIAQTAVAPGMVQFLKGVKDLLPDVEYGVKLMGQSISTAFGQFGKEMQTPWFQGIFKNLLREGNQFVNTVLPAFGQFVQELAIVGSKSGAVTGLANLLAGLAHGLTSLVAATGPFVSGLSSSLSSIGKLLAPIGKVFGTLVGAIGTALAPLLSALVPPIVQFGNVFASVLTQLAPLIAQIAQAIGPLLGGFLTSTLQIAQPFIQALITGLKPVIAGLVPLLSDLGQMFVQNQVAILGVARVVAPLLPAVGNLIGLVLRLITPLIQWATVMNGDVAGALTGFLTGVASVVGAITGWMGKTGNWTAAWRGFTGDVASAWNTMWSNTISPVTNFINSAIHGIGTVALDLWHNTLSPFWSGVVAGFHGLVSGLTPIWDGLETIFKAPVNFLIKTVYDEGIARLWNDVAAKLPGVPKMPAVAGLAAGGMVPGRDRGRDEVLIAARPEEGVLVPGAVRSIGGPAAIDALNAAHGGGPGGGGRHFSGGGIVGDVTGFLGHAWHDVVGGVLDAYTVGRLIASIVTGNTAAFTNAASKFIGTKASGDLGEMMIGVPKAIVKDMAHSLTNLVETPGNFLAGKVEGLLGVGSSAVGNLPANWKTIASFLASHGFSKFAAAGVAGNIMAESGGQPEILEAGGGGGGGLIQWTPYPPGYITGNYQADLMTQLNAILSWGGGPAAVNRATSPSDAALIYQNLYERPASLTASLPIREASANAVYQAMGWGKFDQGGYLPPPINATGQPERVLDPQQTQAFDKLVDYLTRSGGAAAPTVNQYFYASQLGAEQRAEIARDMAMALSGP
jgi:hypothetical protein